MKRKRKYQQKYRKQQHTQHICERTATKTNKHKLKTKNSTGEPRRTHKKKINKCKGPQVQRLLRNSRKNGSNTK